MVCSSEPLKDVAYSGICFLFMICLQVAQSVNTMELHNINDGPPSHVAMGRITKDIRRCLLLSLAVR